MTIQSEIEQKLQSQLSPSYLQVTNESHMHSVPTNSETHFKVVLAAGVFADKNQVQRHQAVYAVLADELSGGVHALALHTYSPGEWQQASQQQGSAVPASPQCMGGSKSE